MSKYSINSLHVRFFYSSGGGIANKKNEPRKKIPNKNAQIRFIIQRLQFISLHVYIHIYINIYLYIYIQGDKLKSLNYKSNLCIFVWDLFSRFIFFCFIYIHSSVEHAYCVPKEPKLI